MLSAQSRNSGLTSVQSEGAPASSDQQLSGGVFHTITLAPFTPLANCHTHTPHRISRSSPLRPARHHCRLSRVSCFHTVTMPRWPSHVRSTVVLPLPRPHSSRLVDIETSQVSSRGKPIFRLSAGYIGWLYRTNRVAEKHREPGFGRLCTSWSSNGENDSTTTVSPCCHCQQYPKYGRYRPRRTSLSRRGRRLDQRLQGTAFWRLENTLEIGDWRNKKSKSIRSTGPPRGRSSRIAPIGWHLGRTLSVGVASRWYGHSATCLAEAAGEGGGGSRAV